ncbi:MAG: site-specific integrase [Cyclobacteriaceae bacterium]|nr:site-specific integrase [Cyclobacteriaceae bacterium]
MQSKIEEYIRSMDTFSFIELENKVANKITPPELENDVYTYFNDLIDKLTHDGRVGTAFVYRDARKSLQKFKSKLAFNQITPEFLREYDARLKKEQKSISTIGIYMRHLRAVVNRAIEAGIIDQKNYPFGKNKYQIKAPLNIKKALTLDQIRKIFDYPVNEGTNQHFARDMWVFSYLCNGMNIKDVISLKFKNIHGDVIYYDRSKTSNTIQNPKPIIINLLPQATEIIERWGNKKRRDNDYVFPILTDIIDEVEKKRMKDLLIRSINHFMRRIGKDIGLEKNITTYSARHSFATVLKRTGAPMEFISEAMGHKSLQTTEAYLESFEDASRRIFMENLIPK